MNFEGDLEWCQSEKAKELDSERQKGYFSLQTVETEKVKKEESEWSTVKSGRNLRGVRWAF